MAAHTGGQANLNNKESPKACGLGGNGAPLLCSFTKLFSGGKRKSLSVTFWLPKIRIIVNNERNPGFRGRFRLTEASGAVNEQ